MLSDRKGTAKVFTLTVRLRFRPVGLTSSRPSFAQNKQRAESTELVVSCRSFTARPNFVAKLSDHGVFSPLTIVNNDELMIGWTYIPREKRAYFRVELGYYSRYFRVFCAYSLV